MTAFPFLCMNFTHYETPHFETHLAAECFVLQRVEGPPTARQRRTARTQADGLLAQCSKTVPGHSKCFLLIY